jgi:hypothetical protein
MSAQICLFLHSAIICARPHPGQCHQRAVAPNGERPKAQRLSIFQVTVFSKLAYRWWGYKAH